MPVNSLNRCFAVLTHMLSMQVLASMSTAGLPCVYDGLLCANAGSTIEALADISKQKKKQGAAKGKKASAAVDIEVDTAQAAGSNPLEAQLNVAPREMVCQAKMSVPHCQQMIRRLCHTNKVVLALLAHQVRPMGPSFCSCNYTL